MQGVIAEYERRKILERTRRGRLYRARQGLLVSGSAPYGYRYIRKRDGVAAHFEVDEETGNEAAVQVESLLTD